MTEFASLLVDELFDFATVRVAMAGKALCCFEAELECYRARLGLFAPVASIAGDRPMRPTQGVGRRIVLCPQELRRDISVHRVAFFAGTFRPTFGKFAFMEICMTILTNREFQSLAHFSR